MHVLFLIARSESMRDLQSNVVDGFNGFVTSHRNRPGEHTLTLVQFDSNDPWEAIHDAVPVEQVPDLTADQYQPCRLIPSRRSRDAHREDGSASRTARSRRGSNRRRFRRRSQKHVPLPERCEALPPNKRLQRRRPDLTSSRVRTRTAAPKPVDSAWPVAPSRTPVQTRMAPAYPSAAWNGRSERTAQHVLIRGRP